MLGDPRQLLGLRVVDQINLSLHPAQGSRGIVFGHGGGAFQFVMGIAAVTPDGAGINAGNWSDWPQQF